MEFKEICRSDFFAKFFVDLGYDPQDVDWASNTSTTVVYAVVDRKNDCIKKFVLQHQVASAIPEIHGWRVTAVREIQEKDEDYTEFLSMLGEVLAKKVAGIPLPV